MMWSRIDYYVQLFTLQLSCAGATLSLLNTGNVHRVGNSISAVSLETNQRLDKLEMIWSENTNRVKAYRRETTSALERQRDNAEAMAGHHSKVLAGLHSSLNQNNTIDRESRQILDKVSGQSDNLLTISTAQFSEIQKLVGTVQDLRLDVQGMRQDQAQRQHGKKLEVGCSGLSQIREKDFDNTGYDEAIIRLCNLAVGTKREISSKEAQSIIHDLKQIIASLLSDAASPADARYKSKTKRHGEAKYDKCKEKIERKDAVHRIEDILGASRRMWLNRRGALEDVRLPSLTNQSAVSKRRCLFNNGRSSDIGIGHGPVTLYSPGFIRHTESADGRADTLVLRKRIGKICYSKDNQETSVAFTQLQDSVSSDLEPFLGQSIVRRDLFSWQTAAGIFDVQYNVQCSRHPNQLHDSETEDAIPDEGFSARVAFTPAPTTISTFQLILNLSQKLMNGNNILSTPVISFRSIVPKTSDIFRIVQYGCVHDLQKALSEGSASLTDCDSKGRSLLNYAMRALRPTMAKFLIEAGADVNSYEVNHLGDMRVPFNWIFCNDHEKSSRKRYLKTACLKMLLSNDADPSLMVNCCDHQDLVTAFYYEIECCSMASLKAFLNLGSPFISPNSTGAIQAGPLEKYPLLVLSVMHRAGTAEAFETAEKVALLLSRGADVNQRDASGNTCLHIVMDYSPLALEIHDCERQNELRDILTLMVTAGADICALNDEKQTPSDIAHRFGHHHVWTEVLDTCGFSNHSVHQAYKADYGWSSAVDQSDSRRAAEFPPKLSFPDYLEQRRHDARCRVVEDIEYSNAEEEHVRELGLDESDYEDSEDEQGDGTGGWDWNTDSDDDSDFDDQQSSKEKKILNGAHFVFPLKVIYVPLTGPRKEIEEYKYHDISYLSSQLPLDRAALLIDYSYADSRWAHAGGAISVLYIGETVEINDEADY